nr:protein S100-A1-like [Paramormyrops kingsleyae]
MPSDLERAMEMLVTVFYRYSKKTGNSNTLSRSEFKQLMETELSTFLKAQRDPNVVDRIRNDLDANGDGELNFEEFVSLVVGLSVACEQIYQLHEKQEQCRK